MSNNKFFCAESGFAPYGDGSGFRVEVTIEQETEQSEPTISFENIWQLPVSEWIAASRKIERMLDLIQRPAPRASSGERQDG